LIKDRCGDLIVVEITVVECYRENTADGLSAFESGNEFAKTHYVKVVGKEAAELIEVA